MSWRPRGSWRGCCGAEGLRAPSLRIQPAMQERLAQASQNRACWFSGAGPCRAVHVRVC